MKSYSVSPGKSLGSYYLGTPISDIISLIESSETLADILYDQRYPLQRDLMLKLSTGILLRFDSHNQRLKMIEVFDNESLVLEYGDKVFSNKNKNKKNSTFVEIFQLFGPTYPGKFNSKECSYYLSYPGISFVFPVPEKYRRLYENGNDEDDIRIQFPDNTTPTFSRMFIYNGDSMDSIKIHKNIKSFYFEEVKVKLGDSIFFTKSKKLISFHDSVQDVLMKMGKPDKIYYKKNDRLKIHFQKESSLSNNSVNRGPVNAIDYFYNYFSIGIDIMFDGINHEVKKIILHTNFPGNKDFNIYKKVNFVLPTNQFFKDGIKVTSKNIINQDSKFSNISKYLKNLKCSKPLVNNSSNANNPFGGTKYYAYDKCIFEVLKNDCLNSICLY